MVEGVDAPRRHGCVENYQAQRLKSREWLRRRLPTSWGGMREAFSGGNKGKVSLIFRAEVGWRLLDAIKLIVIITCWIGRLRTSNVVGTWLAKCGNVVTVVRVPCGGGRNGSVTTPVIPGRGYRLWSVRVLPESG